VTQPLHIDEATVRRLLPMDRAIRVVRDAARALAHGEAAVRPRQRVRHAGAIQQILPAAIGGRLGFKHYISGPLGVTFRVMLFAPDGTWLATIDADALGQLRTGAASGVATDALAAPDARSVAILGTGYQARTQLAAIAAVRTLDDVRVWGRTPAKAAAFAEEMSAELGIAVRTAPDARSAVDGVAIVATMTTAEEPILMGAWLAPGAHVNAAGSNRATHREIDAGLVRRAAVVVVEDVEQAHMEAGDLLRNEEADPWSRTVLLSDVLAGTAPGRSSRDEITLFESLGIGLWDVAAANVVYDAVMVEERRS
jgi:ornithine cyclodeaminase/alanine dehydrogenase-like protein (mu-crystallin family)